MSDFEAALTPHHHKLLTALLSGTYRSTAQLIHAAYGDRIDGGPEWAVKAVQVAIHKIRRQLQPYGIVIENRYNVGYRIAPASLAVARDLIAQTTPPHLTCPHCGSISVDA